MDPKDKDKTEAPDPVQQMRDRLAGLVAEQDKILNTALAAKRDLTDEENTKLKEIETDQTKLEEQVARHIAAAQARARLEQPLPSPVSSDVEHARAEREPQRQAPKDQGVRPPITRRDARDPADTPTHGFATQQEWFKAIRTAAVNPSLIDRRLTYAQAAATTFANEGSGPEGGWAQPPEYSKEIVEAVMGAASLLGRMRPLPSNSNVYQLSVDESTQWGTAGVQAAKTGEGAASTVSNLALQGRVVVLYKATSFVNVSEELSVDNPASVMHINRVMARQLLGIVERWLLRGNGLAEPVGILTAPALVKVAAESSGNGAGTLIRKNLSKCSGRLLPGFDNESFWVVSPSAKIEIEDLLLTAGGNTGRELQAGFGPTLLGKPVVTSMEAQAVGTEGDATCVAPSGFLTLVKAGGIRTDATIYFYFDQGLQTLRSYLRIGQVPLLSAAVAPKLDTSTTLSHCVTTATRS